MAVANQGSQIKNFRLLLGITQSEFAKELDVSQPYLSAIERGIRLPSEQLLSTITFRYRLQPSFFKEKIHYYQNNELQYRITRNSVTHLTQITTAFSITEHYLCKKFTRAESDLPLFRTLTHAPLARPVIEKLAAHCRDYFCVPSKAPIKNITKLLNDHNVLVTTLPIRINDDSIFDGVSSPTMDHNTAVIALNRNRSGDRYRFSAAHELAHLLLHRGSGRNDGMKMEEEANVFAGAFLMPPELIEAHITPDLTLMGYIELKNQWGYSIQAIIRRAYEVGVIDHDRYRSLRMQVAGRGWRINEPGNVLLENLWVQPPAIFIELMNEPDDDASIASISTLSPRNRNK